MKVEYFIASRLIRKGNVSTKKGEKGIRSVIKIAIAGIAIGVMVMISAVAIVTGFQSEIRAKVIGFGSHIQITAFNPLVTDYSRPIDKNQDFVPELLQEPGVKSVQAYTNKEGIIKTEEEMQGVMVKGIGPDFDWEFFDQNIVAGKSFSLSDSTVNDSILISKKLSQKLRLSLHDKVIVYFIQNERSRPRRFYVSGIYETGLEQFDDVYVLADMQHIQNLNEWSPNLVSGLEVILTKYEDLDLMDVFIYKYIDSELTTVKITDLNREIFSWLELQDMNVIIIIVLIILVSGINMTSALLIMILERTGFIGILKAMGMRDWSIRKVFLINAAYLIGVGLLWGNVLGIGLCWLQETFHFVSLPQESYYMPYVPINLEWNHIVLLNVGTLLLCSIMLIIPSYVITKISPVKAIKFA